LGLADLFPGFPPGPDQALIRLGVLRFFHPAAPFPGNGRVSEATGFPLDVGY
jgi:hypothetical protein